jgi:uncharacterized LabA/DUF88 family protein
LQRLDMIIKLLTAVLPVSLLTILKKIYSKKQLRDWYSNGCPVPPPHIVKQLTIKEYQKRSGYKILIETGTFLGDMVEAQKKCFEKIISIELSVELYKKAVKRFKRHSNVEIVYGDSGQVLPEIMKDIDIPAIFWLDGHYSEGITAKGDTDCPIYNELTAIFNDKNLKNIILIDDARCFTGKGDFPRLDELTGFIKTRNQKCQISLENDIIRVKL